MTPVVDADYPTDAGTRGPTSRSTNALLPTLLTLLLSILAPASADEIRPALLDIKQQPTGLYDVTWKVPTRGNRVLAITPILPDSLELFGSTATEDMPGARIERSTYRNNAESLTGQTISIAGLPASQTDVLLLIQFQDCGSH